jgi:hypothetical protein
VVEKMGRWEDGKIGKLGNKLGIVESLNRDLTMGAIVSIQNNFFVSNSTDPSLTGVAS